MNYSLKRFKHKTTNCNEELVRLSNKQQLLQTAERQSYSTFKKHTETDRLPSWQKKKWHLEQELISRAVGQEVPAAQA